MPTKEQAYSECLSVIKNKLATQVLVDKYLLTDNKNYLETTPQQMWKRHAYAISQAEKNPEQWQNKFYDLEADFKFVPAGRVLYGLGNKNVNVTLKNCYVIAIREDSIKGIFDAAYEIAETLKAGGGVGIDISSLRPKGMLVKNAARESTGAVSFMDFYSHITGMIGQKARIGAMLISIAVDHPDVEDFITIKGGDNLDKVRNANVSVRITDEFMQAVTDNTDFDLKWGGKVFKTIKARDLWQTIINRAWKRGEPGLLFWNTIRREGPAEYYDKFISICTNPCLTGSMRLFTESGYKTIRELWAQGGFQEYDSEPTIQKHGELKIVNSNGVVSATNVYRTSECAKVFRVKLKNGIEIDATENHKFILTNGSRKVLSELEIGDELPIIQRRVFGSYNYPEYAELAGWVIGDGSIARTTNGYIRAAVRIWGTDIENVQPRLRQNALNVYNRSNKSTNQSPEYISFDHTPEGFDCPVKEFNSQVLGRLMNEDGLEPGNKHHVPKSIWSGDKETVAAFLRGLFSADGGVQVNHKKKCISIRCCQVNKAILSECQLLLNQFAITSSVHKRRDKSKQLMNDGKGGKKLYNKKAEYEIIISGRFNCINFIDNIGFIQNWKNEIANNWTSAHLGSNNSVTKYSSEIKSIEYLGEEETFCLTEPENHEIVVNSMIIGQCGEVALSDGDSCNLASINLGKYIIDPFDSKAQFNYDQFEKDIRLGVRFLDNIISLEKCPLEFQQWANDNGRRLGLGVMGLADVFMKMCIKYDTDKALSLADHIMNKFKIASYDESCELAIEKGPFPAFEADRHLRSEYVKRLPESIKEKISKTGIRNIAVHAIAPTGSLQCIAQCSAAIEPAFSIHYERKTNLGTAKEVQVHEVWHPAAKEYADKFGVTPDELPDYFVGAHQIDPNFRITLQSVVQKHIDQAISNTVNLPADCEEKQIGDLYFEAWRAGLKGITVYREGSREGVLISDNAKNNNVEIKITQAPKRPTSLDGKVHLIKPNGKQFTVFVGLLKGRPYEVFVLDHAQAGVSDGMTGHIIKDADDDASSGTTYYFESGALWVRRLNKFEDNEISLVTRLMSTALRHGTPLERIIEQVGKSKVPISNFARAIVRALGTYIKQEELIGKFKCRDCGSTEIKFEGSCYTCMSCGSSKCS